tara:strand:- start:46 stop:453 length:408 start_codon:yes stop_codon:yes gene_type:complete
MEKMDKRSENMNLVFDLDGVICAPPSKLGDHQYALYDHCLPLANVTEFMQWLKKENHYITIWCSRPNDLEAKVATEKWLEMNQIPYDRLLFDRPKDPIFVSDTPPNAKYYKDYGDNGIVAMLFNEWIEEVSTNVG